MARSAGERSANLVRQRRLDFCRIPVWIVVRVKPALAHCVVERCGEDVAVVLRVCAAAVVTSIQGFVFRRLTTQPSGLQGHRRGS